MSIATYITNLQKWEKFLIYLAKGIDITYQNMMD